MLMGKSWFGANLPHTRGDEPIMFRGADDPMKNLPHTRGDEPYMLVSQQSTADGICPTRVGMNRDVEC